MTYSELLIYIKDLAESIELVNTVTKGEVSDLDLDKANIYPIVHIDISAGVFSQANTMEYAVYIAALQQRDLNNEVVEDKFWRQDNEVDNHNETLLILQTIWSNIYRDWQDNYISTGETPAFEKITYAKGNILDGWAITFTAEVPFSIDLCVGDYAYIEEAKLIANDYQARVNWDSGYLVNYNHLVDVIAEQLPTAWYKPSFTLYPSGVKEGKVYVERPNVYQSDGEFERASDATYVDANGIIQTADINVPRIEDNALLLEPQSTNLCLWSEDLTNGYWTKTANTVVVNDGTLLAGIPATKITPNIGEVMGVYRFSVTPVSATQTKSFLVKSGGIRYIYIQGQSGAFSTETVFDTETNTFTAIETNSTVKSIDYGNGVYKISVTSSNPNSTTILFGASLDGNQDNLYLGDGVSHVYITAVQAEEQSTATSYIKTEGATVTRATDSGEFEIPTGVNRIVEKVNGVENTITVIPATYIPPIGRIEWVKMFID